MYRLLDSNRFGVYPVPEKPERLQPNWVDLLLGMHWNPLLRLYGLIPLSAWFRSRYVFSRYAILSVGLGIGAVREAKDGNPLDRGHSQLIRIPRLLARFVRVGLRVGAVRDSGNWEMVGYRFHDSAISRKRSPLRCRFDHLATIHWPITSAVTLLSHLKLEFPHSIASRALAR